MKLYKEYYLGHPYGVMPKWMQFIIFIHSGLYNGGGGSFKLYKLGRLNCWFGKHKYHPEYNGNIKIQDFVRNKCMRCGYNK